MQSFASIKDTHVGFCVGRTLNETATDTGGFAYPDIPDKEDPQQQPALRGAQLQPTAPTRATRSGACEHVRILRKKADTVI